MVILASLDKLQQVWRVSHFNKDTGFLVVVLLEFDWWLILIMWLSDPVLGNLKGAHCYQKELVLNSNWRDPSLVTGHNFLKIFAKLIPDFLPSHHHDANFAITDSPAGCHHDNLRCCQWWQSWHHDDCSQCLNARYRVSFVSLKHAIMCCFNELHWILF